MAKSSKSKGGRVHIPNANRMLPRLSVSPLLDLRLLEDRRLYHPLQSFAPPIATVRKAVRVVDRARKSARSKNKILFNHPGTLTFSDPDKVVICVRRKRRKEVLFAKKKAGKTGQRKPRRNYWSSISCKR